MGSGGSARHSRKYGEKESHPIPVWNGLLEKKHFEKIGPALWLYLWLLDRITKEVNGIGIILGGMPIKASAIAETYGMNERTTRAHIDRLKNGGYITVKHAPYGLIITILNSLKFGIWSPSKRSDRNARAEEDRSEENGVEVGKKPAGGRKEPSDVIKTQQDATEDAAVNATPAAGTLNLWNPLGVQIPRGSPRFQQIFERCRATRGGQSISETMERTIWMAHDQGVKVPPPFFEVKRKVERREAEQHKASFGSEIPELEVIPWAT
jgi:hypothetical protein